MFWAGGDPLETIRELKGLGATCGQIGVPGEMVINCTGAGWKAACEAEDFPLATVFASYKGEDYADVPTVQRTVGFIPRDTREERERRTYAISRFAAELGVPSIAAHVGFVPEDQDDPDYKAVKGMVERICDYAATNGQSFALETGQEPAETLLRFLKDVNRPNVLINFDPANMILYGTGDPIQALGLLGPQVVTVHCKDGNWPPKDDPNALGVEVPLGQGDVGMDRYIAKLKEVGYTGPLTIEREVPDQEQRLRDIKMGVRLLNSLR
jgi:sugar phosphate isomerase/epimerase